MVFPGLCVLRRARCDARVCVNAGRERVRKVGICGKEGERQGRVFSKWSMGLLWSSEFGFSSVYIRVELSGGDKI